MSNPTSQADYRKLKEFMSFFVERFFDVGRLPLESHPIACLERAEKKSLTLALKGIMQSINDCIEMSMHFDPAEVSRLDAELKRLGIVTLSEVRRLYSSAYARIVKRGGINSQTEYYLIINVLNDPTEKSSEEIALLHQMISAYEAMQIDPQKS